MYRGSLRINHERVVCDLHDGRTLSDCTVQLLVPHPTPRSRHVAPNLDFYTGISHGKRVKYVENKSKLVKYV